MQARSERLLQSYKQIPGAELPAVRMARELKVEAQSDSRRRTARLMRQQQPQRCAHRNAENRRLGVAALADVEVVHAVVGDPCDHHFVAIVTQHDMLIEQHPQVQASQLGDPGLGTAVLLVVAGDEERAVARPQRGQRRHVPGQFGNACRRTNRL